MIGRSGEVAGHAEPSAGRGEQGLMDLIAKGASKSGGASRPIQVRAQVLRELPAQYAAASEFFLPGDDSKPGTEGHSGGPQWQEADVKRAVAAAEEAGLQDYRIEIATDGTIAIIVGTPPSS